MICRITGHVTGIGLSLALAAVLAARLEMWPRPRPHNCMGM
jgi:hypothetical protein